MTDFLNNEIIQETVQLFCFCIIGGLALSGIGSALSWVVLTAVKLLHKLF